MSLKISLKGRSFIEKAIINRIECMYKGQNHVFKYPPFGDWKIESYNEGCLWRGVSYERGSL